MEDGDGGGGGGEDEEVMMKRKRFQYICPCMHMHAHWRTCTQTYATCMHLYLFIAWLALFDVCIWSLHLGCHKDLMSDQMICRSSRCPRFCRKAYAFM
jgi:hypothetical protein